MSVCPSEPILVKNRFSSTIWSVFFFAFSLALHTHIGHQCLLFRFCYLLFKVYKSGLCADLCVRANAKKQHKGQSPPHYFSFLGLININRFGRNIHFSVVYIATTLLLLALSLRLSVPVYVAAIADVAIENGDIIVIIRRNWKRARVWEVRVRARAAQQKK